ncbi:MAG: serine/threonine-protein kinase [Fimbriimonadaceae bacterium]
MESVLGRGAFGIAYLVRDHKRGDRCVLKELAPENCERSPDGVLQLEALGSTHAQRIRRQFLEEARRTSRIVAPGVLPVRATFVERGTAYYASDAVEGGQTLAQIIAAKGRLEPLEAERILRDLLATLEGVHRAGALHRDIKPANVLVSPKGRAFLIDFGAAREWHNDASVTHTVLLTPGYAPPEQYSERTRRTPASDLYALGATIWHAVVGFPPPSATERAAGSELGNLSDLVPGIPPGLARAVQQAIRLRPDERPHSAAEMLAILDRRIEESAGMLTVEDFDQRALQLKELRWEVRECPACGGLLEHAKPLSRLMCPVCREGRVVVRAIQKNLCPVCRMAPLKAFGNTNPLAVCPICAEGRIIRRGGGIFRRPESFECADCEAKWRPRGSLWALESPGTLGERVAAERLGLDDVNVAMEPALWREKSGRAPLIYICSGCGAQLDELPDGRRHLAYPASVGRYDTLYPDEWDRLAVGLPPDAGNAECDACGADYFLEGESMTLLGAAHDPFGFQALHQGRLLSIETCRWLGVGKESPRPGEVCADCGTEFDTEGAYRRLVASNNRLLVGFIGQTLTAEDWQRAGKGLPLVHQEEQFEADFDAALVRAYATGQMAFDDRNPEAVWSSPATRLESSDGDKRSSGQLVVTNSEVSFGGLLRKWKVPTAALVEASGRGDVLTLSVSGESDPVVFHVDPVEWTIQLRSGRRRLELRAEHLAARLAHGLRLGAV